MQQLLASRRTASLLVAYRLLKVLNPGLQLHKRISLASDVLLVQLLRLKHPHLQHTLMPA